MEDGASNMNGNKILILCAEKETKHFHTSPGVFIVQFLMCIETTGWVENFGDIWFIGRGWSWSWVVLSNQSRLLGVWCARAGRRQSQLICLIRTFHLIINIHQGQLCPLASFKSNWQTMKSTQALFAFVLRTFLRKKSAEQSFHLWHIISEQYVKAIPIANIAIAILCHNLSLMQTLNES